VSDVFKLFSFQADLKPSMDSLLSCSVTLSWHGHFYDALYHVF